MGKLKSYQQQIQEIVEKGITTAEEQQKKLAAKPFDYAEKLESEVRQYNVHNVRLKYNKYSENLFDQLRNLNSRVGSFAADLVARLEKEAAEGADNVSEAAEEVSSAAQSAKKEVAGEKKPAARKSTTAKKSTASSQTTSA